MDLWPVSAQLALTPGILTCVVVATMARVRSCALVASPVTMMTLKPPAVTLRPLGLMCWFVASVRPLSAGVDDFFDGDYLVIQAAYCGGGAVEAQVNLGAVHSVILGTAAGLQTRATLGLTHTGQVKGGSPYTLQQKGV